MRVRRGGTGSTRHQWYRNRCGTVGSRGRGRDRDRQRSQPDSAGWGRPKEGTRPPPQREAVRRAGSAGWNGRLRPVPGKHAAASRRNGWYADRAVREARAHYYAP
ncbi:hypothetical protein Pme01_11910 [Planosporangium mesophilum]|uniref:Uncharacterized protein n=1 Tax=Planosporangium mesophilum TaxID=689768 RepID=A0A8J3T845_9ACTN|nr:hypothetical protein Pme01_11910 [Planosporangium mesophilum]